MTMNFQPASAKIYEFPARGRFAAGGRIDAATSPAKFLTPRGAAVVPGSNWYHEEAIQEEQKHND